MDIVSLMKIHKVMVYSLANCPYCVQAKNLLSKMKVDFHQIECNKIKVRRAQLEELYSISKMKTYPQVFVKGSILGGFTELETMQKNGTLYKLFDKENIKYIKI